MRAAAPLLVLLAASAQAPAQEAEGLSLPDLVREALDHNPEIQTAARTLEAKRARVPQAAALPDPMLMYGVINEGRPVPFQTLGERDFSEAYVGVSQDLPFPGKRRLRKEAAQEEVEAAQSAYQGARRRVAVGQTSQQDVLDAEVEMSRLEERRTELAARRAILEERLRSLLYRRTPEPLGRPVPVTPTPVPGPLDELLRQAEEQSPAITEKARMVAQAERLADLAKRDRKPDFSVNFTYHNRRRLDPMYSFGGTLTLPNLHGRQGHAVEEAVASLGGARSGVDMARADIRYAVTEAYQTASSAGRLLRLYDEGILKQARLSLDSALAQYRVGKTEFLTLITSWRRLLDYDLTYQEQLAAHEKALARLAVHVGPAPDAPR